MAYLTCHTQWNVAGMGGRTGLRYADCLALLGHYLPAWQLDAPRLWAGIELTGLMQDVQIIEAAYLTAWGEKAQASETTPGSRHGSHH